MILDKRRTLVVLFLVMGASLFLLLLPEFEPFELKTLDYRSRIAGQSRVSSDIVLVDIDDETIKALGYPLSRDFQAGLIDILRKAGARVIGFDILFTDPDRYNPKYDALLATLTEEAGNVCHAVGFKITESKDLIRAEEMVSSLPELLKTTKSLGHINIIPDKDGVVRKIPLVIEYKNKRYLSLGCQMAADYLGISQNQISVGEKEVILDKIHIPVNKKGEMLINYGPGAGFRRYSFLEILQSFKALKEGRIPSLNLSDFKDKLVLVGVTASGASDLRATPFASISPMFEVHGQIVSNILKQSFLIKASKFQNLLIFLPFCFLMGLFLSCFRPLKAPFIFFTSLAAYGVFSLLLFRFAGIWIDLVKPGLVLFFSFIGFVCYQMKIKTILEKSSVKEMVEIMVRVEERIKTLSKEATVLAIDIVNYTGIKEGENQANIIYTFEHYRQLLDGIVEENKGELLNWAGDGVIYRFQAPDQAIKAAVGIKEALVNFNKKANQLRKPISVRMGINSGEVLIDEYERRNGKGGKISSHTIDIAGHLQKEAKIGEILITEETFKRLEELSFFEESGYLERDGIKIYRYRSN